MNRILLRLSPSRSCSAMHRFSAPVPLVRLYFRLPIDVFSAMVGPNVTRQCRRRYAVHVSLHDPLVRHRFECSHIILTMTTVGLSTQRWFNGFNFLVRMMHNKFGAVRWSNYKQYTCIRHCQCLSDIHHTKYNIRR